MNNAQLLSKLDGMEWEIATTPEIERIRAEVTRDKRRGLTDLSEKPIEWQKHRADAVAFCRKIICLYQGRPAPIEVVFSKEFSTYMTRLFGGKIQFRIDPDGWMKAFKEYWQLAEHLPSIREKIPSQNKELDRLFREFLAKEYHELPKRPRGQVHSNAQRNLLIALMLKALQKLGWPTQRNPETKLPGSAVDIVYQAYCGELGESKNKQFKTDTIVRIWKQFRSHEKASLTYLGTPLKARKSGALHLITHAK